MLQVRRSDERGHADHGWLKSKHTFSFAEYYDPDVMGFRSLRVINEDRIEGGTGFGAHPHRDMEIVSYVVKGALQHQDSIGNKAVIRPGEVQRMSAGSGVTHSEYNASPDEEAHFFQIWILPKARGGDPGYGQKSFEAELAQNRLVLTVSEDGRDGSIAINQDADLYIARMRAGQQIEHSLRKGRGAWIQVVKGSVKVNGREIESGDGLAVELEGKLDIKNINAADGESEILLFDLA